MPWAGGRSSDGTDLSALTCVGETVPGNSNTGAAVLRPADSGVGQAVLPREACAAEAQHDEQVDATLTRQREIMVEAALRATPTVERRILGDPPPQVSERTPIQQGGTNSSITAFERGYRDYGGREEWLVHF